MDFENLITSFNIGKIDDNPAIKSAWAQQRFIENIRTVCRSDQNDPFIGIKTIHLDEKLIERLFSFIMPAANSRSSMTSDSIDLIDKNDARSMFLCLIEQIANPASANTYEHLDKIRT